MRNVAPSEDVVKRLLVELSRAKHEVRIVSNDVYDLVVAFLSGDANDEGQEISYTKQQQKQKQKQQNKNMDSDTMESWDKRHQYRLAFESDYYQASKRRRTGSHCLALPIPKLASGGLHYARCETYDTFVSDSAICVFPSYKTPVCG